MDILPRIPAAGAARIRRRPGPQLWQRLVDLVRQRDELGSMLACAGALAWVFLLGAALHEAMR